MRLFPRPRWRWVLSAFVLGLVLAGGALSQGLVKTPAATPIPQQGAQCAQSVDVILSPGATGEMVAALDGAQSSIDVLLFEFSSSALKNALARAAQRGVQVRIVLDPKVDQNLGTASFLKNASIQVRWSSNQYVYTHAKLAIIDGERVLVGSINWSNNALTRNREAEVLIESAAVAAEFQTAFDTDWAKARDATA